MPTAPPTSIELAALAAFDTPTICNALELVIPETRGHGYTTQAALCGFPAMKPIVGFARTATIRAKEPSTLPAAEQRRVRHDYYRYIEAGPKPSLVLIQDLDGPDAGYGAFWGEVQSAIHRGLGARGLVTNGSVRDIDAWAPDFNSSRQRSRPRMPTSTSSTGGGSRSSMRCARRYRACRSPRRGRRPGVAVRELPAARIGSHAAKGTFSLPPAHQAARPRRSSRRSVKSTPSISLAGREVGYDFPWRGPPAGATPVPITLIAGGPHDRPHP
jgi:hypothetical protein